MSTKSGRIIRPTDSPAEGTFLDTVKYLVLKPIDIQRTDNPTNGRTTRPKTEKAYFRVKW